MRMQVVPNCRVVLLSSVEVGVYTSRTTVTEGVTILVYYNFDVLLVVCVPTVSTHMYSTCYSIYICRCILSSFYIH